MPSLYSCLVTLLFQGLIGSAPCSRSRPVAAFALIICSAADVSGAEPEVGVGGSALESRRLAGRRRSSGTVVDRSTGTLLNHSAMCVPRTLNRVKDNLAAADLGGDGVGHIGEAIRTSGIEVIGGEAGG